MELIFKLPPGKAPFLGIMYTHAYGAAKDNKDLVEENCSGFELRLIPAGYNIHVKLRRPEDGSTRWYRDLRYNKARFTNWMRYATGRVNFGHVTRAPGKDVLAKTLTKKMPFVLKIDKISVEEEY